MDGHMQVRLMPGLVCTPTRAGRKPTFEVEEEGEPIGHHGSLAAYHAVAQECLRVSAQGLRCLGTTHTHPDTSVCSSERGWVDACRGQR